MSKARPSGFAQFALDGFQILERLVDSAACDSLAAELTSLFDLRQASSRRRIGGIRNLLGKSASVRAIATSPKITSLLSEAAGASVFPVRATLFDKIAASNWGVAWHQDVSIAVMEQRETPGFTGWSVKAGVVHVLPPTDLLEGLIALRLHLDDCEAANGALKVIPKSHQAGKLSDEEINACVAAGKPVVCEVRKGGAVLMRPLLLHSSSASETPCRRRVLHIEYATSPLPNGLKWLEA